MVNTNRVRLPQPVVPLGMCRVADALVAEGHVVELLDLCFRLSPRHALRDMVLRFSPDVVGMSVRNLDNSDAIFPREYLSDLVGLVNEVKRISGATVVLGGPAVSIAPSQLVERTGADHAVVGEGEWGFPQLLRQFGEPCVCGTNGAGSRVQGAGQKDCMWAGDSLPIERLGRRRLKQYAASGASAPIQSKIGCAHDCVYCTYPSIDGPSYRTKPSIRVIDEIRAISSLEIFRSAEFVDSVFNEPLDYAVSLCDEIAWSGNTLPLHTTTVNPSQTPASLFRKMQRAGFVAFACSLESASDEVLHRLDKGFTARDVHETVRAARLTEMARMWVFLMGGPGETERTARTTLDFIARYAGDRDMVLLTSGVRIYPGTQLERIAMEEGVIGPDTDLLSPHFYFSPELGRDGLVKLVREQRLSSRVLSLSHLSTATLAVAERAHYLLGLPPPSWRYGRVLGTLRRL